MPKREQAGKGWVWTPASAQRRVAPLAAHAAACAAPSLPMLQVQSLQGALKREQTEVLRLREQLQLMTAGGWGGATPS